MALSDATVRQARATGKDYTLGDIDGLSLAVTASGGRSRHFRYCWAGKRKRMSLGAYPEVGLWVCGRPALCGMRHARCWPRGSTLGFTANTPFMSSGRRIKTRSKACLTVGSRTGP